MMLFIVLLWLLVVYTRWENEQDIRDLERWKQWKMTQRRAHLRKVLRR